MTLKQYTSTMNKSPEKSDLKYFRDFSGAAVFALSFLWFYFPGEYVLIANQDNNLFITSFDYFYSFLIKLISYS